MICAVFFNAYLYCGDNYNLKSGCPRESGRASREEEGGSGQPARGGVSCLRSLFIVFSSPVARSLADLRELADQGQNLREDKGVIAERCMRIYLIPNYACCSGEM